MEELKKKIEVVQDELENVKTTVNYFDLYYQRATKERCPANPNLPFLAEIMCFINLSKLHEHCYFN